LCDGFLHLFECGSILNESEALEGESCARLE
jgi:hypothetical protein